MSQHQQVTIHTDGACSGNPGPGGFGAVIELPNGDEVIVTGGDPQTTNNRMELAAVIEALALLKDCDVEADLVTVRSDSKYVVDAFNQGWLANWQKNGWRTAAKKPVLNQDLWQRMLEAAAGYDVHWVWVKGHSGDPMNERCDELAVAEADFAPQTDGYWYTVGPPRSTAGAPQPQATPGGKLRMTIHKLRAAADLLERAGDTNAAVDLSGVHLPNADLTGATLRR